MSAQNLFVELFVEELPPKALKRLGEAFAAALAESLVAQGLADAKAAVTNFASPRRLGAHVAGVLARAADKPVSTKLMPVSVGLNVDGKATPALLKRLAALGADESAVSQLRRAADGKNEALFHDSIALGMTLADGLQRALEAAMAKLPIPKVMTYQLADGWSSVNFVRPVHGLVALHGADIVPVSVLGLLAGRDTQGHRFEAKVNPVVIQNADSYAAQLHDEGAVIADYEERAYSIIKQLRDQAKRLGAHLEVEPENLTDIEAEEVLQENPLIQEVTSLVEYPNVLIGQFDRAFLQVPQECLILTMKANQKYFPLLDAAGKLTNRFLIVSNISPDDASVVIGGNERVVRPRLADAKFFFDQDRKKPLDSRVLGLAKVVYHNKLGTQGERVMRVQAIARAIAQQIDYKLYGHMLSALTDKAALLAKADLLTDMVGEFPELQGIMGRYYALHDGEDALVAEAIEDHYKPRFAGDELPRSDVGVCVALADKLETLVGMFGIGEIPTGDKDPFALRRHALGVLRLMVEAGHRLSQRKILEVAVSAFPDGLIRKSLPDEGVPLWKQVDIFINERAVGYWKEKGHPEANINAVLEVSDAPMEHAKRLVAVKAFAELPESITLAAANKRVGNILKKVEGGVPVEVNTALFKEPAETALFESLAQIKPEADAAFEAGDYTVSLQALAALKTPVDAFFDSVMVNADDHALKANRLALLNQLHQTMNRVADISRLAA